MLQVFAYLNNEVSRTCYFVPLVILTKGVVSAMLT